MMERPVGLRLSSGVPVVDVRGEWDSACAQALEEALRRLAQAGHYEIIVNVTQSARGALHDCAPLLTQWAQTLRERCGSLDVVGTRDQLEGRLAWQAPLRPVTSEESAICRIKRLPMAVSGPGCNARFSPERAEPNAV